MCTVLQLKWSVSRGIVSEHQKKKHILLLLFFPQLFYCCFAFLLLIRVTFLGFVSRGINARLHGIVFFIYFFIRSTLTDGAYGFKAEKRDTRTLVYQN